MKLPTEHTKAANNILEQTLEEKATRDLGPEDITAHTRDEGPTVQLCGDSNVACKWINGEFAEGTKYKETIGERSKDLTFLMEEKSCLANLRRRQRCEARQQRT